jgi:hypothetical protein
MELTYNYTLKKFFCQEKPDHSGGHLTGESCLGRSDLESHNPISGAIPHIKEKEKPPFPFEISWQEEGLKESDNTEPCRKRASN